MDTHTHAKSCNGNSETKLAPFMANLYLFSFEFSFMEQKSASIYVTDSSTKLSVSDSGLS